MYEPVLLLGQDKFSEVDIRIRVKGGGFTAQIYAIRQAIAKALVAYYQKVTPHTPPDSRNLPCYCFPAKCAPPYLSTGCAGCAAPLGTLHGGGGYLCARVSLYSRETFPESGACVGWGAGQGDWPVTLVANFPIYNCCSAQLEEVCLHILTHVPT